MSRWWVVDATPAVDREGDADGAELAENAVQASVEAPEHEDGNDGREAEFAEDRDELLGRHVNGSRAAASCLG